MTTEDRMIESAANLFSRKGYKNTSIKEIARKAEVNSLTIFRYFHDKETLFFQTVEHMKQHTFCPQALNERLTFQNVVEDLMIIGLAYVDEIYASLPLMRIYIGEGMNFEQLKEERWFISPVLKEHFISYIQSLEQACPLAKEHAGLIAQMFIAYITRKVMPSNKHRDVWQKTSEIEASFYENFRPQAKYIAFMISGEQS